MKEMQETVQIIITFFRGDKNKLTPGENYVCLLQHGYASLKLHIISEALKLIGIKDFYQLVNLFH